MVVLETLRTILGQLTDAVLFSMECDLAEERFIVRAKICWKKGQKNTEWISIRLVQK